MKRSLSGIKPTGDAPHLGNYFGMIKPCIDLQDVTDALYFIADYHALTQVRDPELINNATYTIAAYFLALGLDPEKASLFCQSSIPETTELAWMLNCLMGVGQLMRSHAYKSAIEDGRQVNAGTFCYPVLMAADILIYGSDVVPIGADQIQHIEIAREMANRFNSAYGELFKEPDPYIFSLANQKSVIGLDGRKMSKSYGNTICPLDAPKKIRKKIMSIQTTSIDMSEPLPTEDCTILNLFRLLATEEEVKELISDYERPDFGYGHAKQVLYEKMVSHFAPARELYLQIKDERTYLDQVLNDGAGKVRPLVEEKMKTVRKSIGLR